jgi:hypothetical protein
MSLLRFGSFLLTFTALTFTALTFTAAGHSNHAVAFVKDGGSHRAECP